MVLGDQEANQSGQAGKNQMTTYDFVHLVLLASDGKIEGRTKLQKVVYFAGVFTDQLDDLGYRAHFFGPYSGEVAGAVEDLHTLNFLKQDISTYGNNPNSGFEVTRYDYELTEDGKKMALHKAELEPELWKSIQDAVKKMDRPDAQDYVKLSIAAKTYLMLKDQNKNVSESELQEMAKKYGWDITADQVTEAGKLLVEWDLVEMN